jgi:hypothetical protein
VPTVERSTRPGYLSAMAHRQPPPDRALDLAPDPVIEAYKRDLDRTLLRENLKKSVEERVASLIALHRLAGEARRAGRLGSGRAAGGS